MMVQRLGDGQSICGDCWEREFDAPEPIYGWVSGECDFCERSEAVTSRENGKEGSSHRDKK